MGVRHDPDNQNELHHRESFEAESMKPDDARYQSVDPPEGRHANAAPLGLGSNKIAGFGGFSIDQGLRPWLLNSSLPGRGRAAMPGDGVIAHSFKMSHLGRIGELRCGDCHRHFSLVGSDGELVSR